MTTVHIITEDKTGGGLEAILRAEAQHQRRGLGRQPLVFPLKRAAVNGNTQLIEQCRKYPLLRFNYKPRIEHVFYVIDARNAWDLTQLGVQAPQPPYSQSLPIFEARIRAGMVRLAQDTRTELEWKELSAGFHPHVLVWERESLILPVADRLGLGQPVPDVYDARSAAELVKRMFGQGRTRGYSKATEGLVYLERIAQDEALRDMVLASNASLRGIVEEFVSL